MLTDSKTCREVSKQGKPQGPTWVKSSWDNCNSHCKVHSFRFTIRKANMTYFSYPWKMYPKSPSIMSWSSAWIQPKRIKDSPNELCWYCWRWYNILIFWPWYSWCWSTAFPEELPGWCWWRQLDAAVVWCLAEDSSWICKHVNRKLSDLHLFWEYDDLYGTFAECSFRCDTSEVEPLLR